MMNILHTSDWHFGKQLYKCSLHEEIELFLIWLENQISVLDIDVLLLSGDVFDVMNPSNTDKQMYFNFLKKLRELNVYTVITGGNHDSVSFLNSSKTYLEQDNIYVLGGATSDLDHEILFIELKGESVVICAVPFLRDRDLRHQTTDVNFTSRHQAIQYGLEQHYQKLLVIAKQKYPKTPIVAMGHLFAVGASTSDSERDIHIGNTGQVSHRVFDGFDYVALGHIHKPQIINGNPMIRYCGSPIALSFSERKDDKQLLLLCLKNNILKEPKIITVPKFRALVRFKGSLEIIKERLSNYDFSKSILPAYIELHVKEYQNNLETIQEIDNYISLFNEQNIEKIIAHKITFTKASDDLSVFYDLGVSIQDLSEKEVFEKKVLSVYPDITKENKEVLLTTFNELLELYYKEEF